jgi:hypothetical protein
MVLAIRWMLLFGVVHCFNHRSPEFLFKIGKTDGTDPTIIVLRCISFLKRVRTAIQTELDPAKLAMVMIPVSIPFIMTVSPVNEGDPLKVLVLASKSPVVFLFHRIFTDGN